MRDILRIWRGAEEYQWTRRAVGQGKTALLSGLTAAAKASVTAALYEDFRQPMLLIAATEDEARRIYENIQPLLGEKALYFPVLELLPFEVYARNIELIAERIAVLSALSRGGQPLVITCLNAVLRRLPPPRVFAEQHLRIDSSFRMQPAQLARRLSELGYEKNRLTEIPGSFSVRGSIVDIFPIGAEVPVRIEFFDDELDSLRHFDPTDQRSAAHIEHVVVAPARELPLTEEARQRALVSLQTEVAKLAEALKGPAKKQLLDQYNPLIEYLKQGVWDMGMEALQCFFYPDSGSLLDYLRDGLLLLSEAGKIKQQAEDKEYERQSSYFELLDAGKLLPSFYENFNSYAALLNQFTAAHPLLLSQLDTGQSEIKVEAVQSILTRELASYAHNPQSFTDDTRHFRQHGYTTFISASSELRLKRVQEIVQEAGFPAVHLLEAGFNQGYESPSLKLALITEQELFAQEGKRKARRIYKGGDKIENFLDLQPGDYVVHVTQGIGRYIGVERLEVDEIRRDYLLIQYAGEDRLYLPVDQLDLIQKYVGNEGTAPKLYRLGGGDWNRVKARVKASVQDMAKELLALYAKRAAAVGYAFGKDTNWQREFEDAFPYEETPDQLKAVDEIKLDMESEKVMDRLLCGDVGYGKTEIALRATFKAVMDGKQVGILAPTTVLAQQHLRTIEQRFAGYPVKAGCLSRFASAKEQKQLLSGLEAGEIDIMVGTHRLLSKDVKFKEMGLLIVDEEQRFGVAHKEKIKALRGNVDVLTLSATPIPRTLHMALVGMRDMSIIATPPQDRRPVQTYVVEYNERLIREVVLRELGRGGQIYFVHNRVHNIYEFTSDLQALIPEARIIVGHGQMREKELEQVMLDFVQGQADILVCTTIIESGLDIPNVNTLIVDEADNFGLAQLYQLRGRVGRSQRQAFAYFTYHRDRVVNEMAQKRLVAIRDFTELGAGFKIAMRDLELRGAGNILGPEQSGHIMAVGFDLYCRLLQEEMARQAGEAPPRDSSFSTLMELQMDAFIPDNYLDDPSLKVEVYKRVAACESLAQVDELTAELIDRYGQRPKPLRNLLLLGKIKVLCKHLMIHSILQKPAHLEINFSEGHPVLGEHLVELLQLWPRGVMFQDKKGFQMKLKTGDLTEPADRARKLLKLLANLLDITGVMADNQSEAVEGSTQSAATVE